MVLVSFSSSLEGWTFGPCRHAILALEAFSDAYTAISVLNGPEHEGSMSKLGPDRDGARKPTVRSVAQHAEFTLGQTMIRRFDRG